MHNSFFAALRAAHTRTHGELQGLLQNIAPERLRVRPHAEMNSMVWSIWHSFRSEDACISRFVVPQQQVLTTGNFNARMGIPFRGDGFGMSSADVTALSRDIDIAGLVAYGQAVHAQSAQVEQYAAQWDLSVPFAEADVRAVLATYADLADDDGGTVGYMGSMTKADYLLKHLYGHSQYHLGEISAIDGQVSGARFFSW